MPDDPAEPSLLRDGLHKAFTNEGFGCSLNVPVLSRELAGIRVAAKDVLDVAGLRMGAGNPTWHAQQAPARSTAFVIRALIACGANWVGKTVTDELAFGLTGSNQHYGTPINPADNRRLPGGSSSGSAVAVASGAVDLAIGTDCGGSMRLPASYCGIWGVRPTHGLVTKDGSFSLAHSFDTIGWFAREGELLARAFALTTHSSVPLPSEPTYLVSAVAREACDPETQDAFDQLVVSLKRHARIVETDELPLALWSRAHSALQAAEAWQQHGEWVQRFGDTLARAVQDRFLVGADVKRAEVSAQRNVRVSASQMMASVFRKTNAFLLQPTVPGPAPLADAPADELEVTRRRSQQLLCIAGLTGLPQVSQPWISIAGGPVGLSLIGPRWSDEAVISAGLHLNKTLQDTPLTGALRGFRL